MENKNTEKKLAICINPYGSNESGMPKGEGFNTTKGEQYFVEESYVHEEEKYYHVYNLEGVWIETSCANRFELVGGECQ